MDITRSNRGQLEFHRSRIEGFVPPDSFDIHAHVYRAVDASDSLPKHLVNGQGEVGHGSWRGALSNWMGNRSPVAGLFFAFPKPDVNFDEANRFVLDQIDGRSNCRALLLIHPSGDPMRVAASVNLPLVAGFKVYHVFATRSDTFQADPAEFIPEWAWEIADQRELVIMLHVVRSRALADDVNQRYIRSHCERYSSAKLVLAHAARGFCSAHTVEGIAALRGLDNVYFDTSAVCESSALEAILRTFGPSRLMFGSDFPVSEISGRCVSIGDSFLWLGEKNVDWSTIHSSGPTLVGVESLMAIEQACRTTRLRDSDIERIFCDNARQVLRLDGLACGAVTQRAYDRAKRIIPGGTQLLSKRPEMYAPGHWPAYYGEARGCQIVDLDGREFCDMTTSGIGSCLLGYADPDVSDAVIRRVQLGSMCSLNAVEELKLAELLVSLHPWADQARFCRTGGESMAVAVRIARAATKRDVIAFCGYHGWSDWYLAANLPEPIADSTSGCDRLANHLLSGLSPNGVPSGLSGTALPFTYNHLDQLRQIVNDRGSRLAAVVLEPFRMTEPAAGFLEGVRALCDTCGAVMVMDEITSGWRFGLGGIHLRFGIEPDMAVFAKAIGNGHPLGAIVGRSRVMEAAQSTFISSTYWTEAVGPTAALATIRKMQRVDVPGHVERIGEMYREGLLELGSRHNLPVRVTGRGALLHIALEHSESAALITLFTTRMLDYGFLAGSQFYPSLAHEEKHVRGCLAAANEVFTELAAAVFNGDLHDRIKDGIKHSGFARLT